MLGLWLWVWWMSLSEALGFCFPRNQLILNDQINISYIQLRKATQVDNLILSFQRARYSSQLTAHSSAFLQHWSITTKHIIIGVRSNISAPVCCSPSATAGLICVELPDPPISAEKYGKDWSRMHTRIASLTKGLCGAAEGLRFWRF